MIEFKKRYDPIFWGVWIALLLLMLFLVGLGQPIIVFAQDATPTLNPTPTPHPTVQVELASDAVLPTPRPVMTVGCSMTDMNEAIAGMGNPAIWGMSPITCTPGNEASDCTLAADFYEFEPVIEISETEETTPTQGYAVDYATVCGSTFYDSQSGYVPPCGSEFMDTDSNQRQWSSADIWFYGGTSSGHRYWLEFQYDYDMEDPGGSFTNHGPRFQVAGSESGLNINTVYECLVNGNYYSGTITTGYIGTDWDGLHSGSVHCVVDVECTNCVDDRYSTGILPWLGRDYNGRYGWSQLDINSYSWQFESMELPQDPATQTLTMTNQYLLDTSVCTIGIGIKGAAFVDDLNGQYELPVRLLPEPRSGYVMTYYNEYRVDGIAYHLFYGGSPISPTSGLASWDFEYQGYVGEELPGGWGQPGTPVDVSEYPFAISRQVCCVDASGHCMDVLEGRSDLDDGFGDLIDREDGFRFCIDMPFVFFRNLYTHVKNAFDTTVDWLSFITGVDPELPYVPEVDDVELCFQTKVYTFKHPIDFLNQVGLTLMWIVVGSILISLVKEIAV